MSSPPDIEALAEAAHADFQRRREWLRTQSEPLDAETVLLLREQLVRKLGEVHKLTNILINRPRGLPEPVISELQTIKLALVGIQWYLDNRHQDKHTIADDPGLLDLINQHLGDSDELGRIANRLFEWYK